MKPRDTAAGSGCLPVVFAQHEDRAVETFDQTRGHDSENAAVPLGCAENQRETRWLLLFANGQDFFYDSGFFRLAARVQALQLLSDGPRAYRVFREEQFHYAVGTGHAAGGIDSRCNLKP